MNTNKAEIDRKIDEAKCELEHAKKAVLDFANTFRELEQKQASILYACRRVATVPKFICPPVNAHQQNGTILALILFIITPSYFSAYNDLRCEIPAVYSPCDFAFFRASPI